MAARLVVRMKQRTVVEFRTVEEVPPVDIHRRLKNVYGDSTMDVGHSVSRARKPKDDEPQCGRPASAVTPENKSRIDALLV